MPERVRWRDALGVLPVRERAREAWLALAGDPTLPKSRFDTSSLPLLMPRFAIPMWRGREPVPRRVVVTNLFNHRQTPASEGWSVRRRQVEDFRGGRMTYDSHDGTDLAIALGTVVVAPAAGRVVRVSMEFHRGGLKVVLDHGRSLVTGYGHLARTLVRPGELVARGQPIALSGMSGLDGLTMFPWLAPHVHWNVWLGDAHVDPFARDGTGESPIFVGGRAVGTPARESERPSARDVESDWDHAAVAEVLRSCKHDDTRERLSLIGDPVVRAGSVLLEVGYFPTRFGRVLPLLRGAALREERLDLPFRRADFDGLVLADEV